VCIPPLPGFKPFTITAEGGTCRHCKREVVHGADGWRVDDGSLSPQACASAPLGFHVAG
jgi:hypothetical protein